MNTIILKQIIILSTLLGAILGIITLIPFVGTLSFWILMCFSATCVILFMLRFGLLQINSVKESVILGAVIGFVTFVGFSIFYIPLAILLEKVFHIASNYLVSVALSNASFGLILVLVIFMGILCATVNAFSGFLTYFGVDFYNNLQQNKNENEQFRLK